MVVGADGSASESNNGIIKQRNNGVSRRGFFIFPKYSCFGRLLCSNVAVPDWFPDQSWDEGIDLSVRQFLPILDPPTRPESLLHERQFDQPRRILGHP